jgi:hypothetical protein
MVKTTWSKVPICRKNRFSLDKIGGFFPLIDLDHTEEAFPGSSSETPYPNHAVNRLEKERFVK